MAQRTAGRLFEAARPYWGLFLLGVGATLVASVLDTATIVILVPLLKALFGGEHFQAALESPVSGHCGCPEHRRGNHRQSKRTHSQCSPLPRRPHAI